MNSHILTARLEHAIVVNQHRAYALRESGQLDRLSEIELELDYLNIAYFKTHHNPSPVQSVAGLEAGVLRETRDSYPVKELAVKGGLNALSSYNHEHKGGAT
jgi:hypothetical protein